MSSNLLWTENCTFILSTWCRNLKLHFPKDLILLVSNFSRSLTRFDTFNKGTTIISENGRTIKCMKSKIKNSRIKQLTVTSSIGWNFKNKNSIYSYSLKFIDTDGSPGFGLCTNYQLALEKTVDLWDSEEFEVAYSYWTGGVVSRNVRGEHKTLKTQQETFGDGTIVKCILDCNKKVIIFEINGNKQWTINLKEEFEKFNYKFEDIIFYPCVCCNVNSDMKCEIVYN